MFSVLIAIKMCPGSWTDKVWNWRWPASCQRCYRQPNVEDMVLNSYVVLSFLHVQTAFFALFLVGRHSEKKLWSLSHTWDTGKNHCCPSGFCPTEHFYTAVEFSFPTSAFGAQRYNCFNSCFSDSLFCSSFNLCSISYFSSVCWHYLHILSPNMAVQHIWQPQVHGYSSIVTLQK